MGRRDSAILELLTRKGRMEVSILAQELGVSKVTMRKDLDALESKGVIIRQHGYAMPGSSDDINGRLAYHYETKIAVARRAAKCVSDGDTIMIESGSCCCLLAREIVETKRDVTIITNSAFIASYVRDCPQANIILLGGMYQKDAQVTVGPILRHAVEGFCVQRLFVGTDGYATQGGFANGDHLRAEAVRDMAAQAQDIIVLTESEKFYHRGVVPLGISEKVSTVITDDGIPAEIKKELEAQGSQVITVAKVM